MKSDLSYLREMSGGNKDLVLEMIGIFEEQVEDFVLEMTDLLERKEYELLSKLAHKAKSSISIMGLDQLARELKSLEIEAKAGRNKENYPLVIEMFRKETRDAVEELQEVKKNIDQYI